MPAGAPEQVLEFLARLLDVLQQRGCKAWIVIEFGDQAKVAEPRA